MTGEQIKKMRKKLDYTQFDLASKVGVTRDTIAKWEDGKSSPKEGNQRRLRMALGLPEGGQRKSKEVRAYEKEKRVFYMERMDLKVDNWNKLDDNDPDLLALRELMMG